MNVIEQVEALYDKGEYTELLNLLDQENLSSLSDQDQMYLLYFKGTCKNKLRQYEEAMKVVQDGKEKFQTNQHNYGFFALDIALSESLLWNGERDKASQVLADAIERSESFLVKSIPGKKLLARAYNDSIVIKSRSGDFIDMSLISKSLKLYEEIGNKLGIAFENMNIGVFKANAGEYVKALTYFEESILLFEEIDNKYYMKEGYEKLGYTFLHLAEYDKCLEYSQKAVKICKENGFEYYSSLQILGKAYLLKGDYVPAEKYFFEGLSLAEKHNNLFQITENLVDLFNLYHINNDTNSMNRMIDKIKALPDDIDQCKYSKMLCEGKFYLYQDHIRDKLKSITFFEKVMKVKEYNMGFYLDALYSLCELSIIELKITPVKDTLNKTIDLVNQMYEYSKKQNVPQSLIQALILRSRLNLLHGEIEKAESQLNEALQIATEKGISYLINVLESEKDKLIADLKKWQSLISENASLVERLQFSEFEEYVKNAKQMASILNG